MGQNLPPIPKDKSFFQKMREDWFGFAKKAENDAEKAEKEAQMSQDEMDALFENFDPKTDKKKLTTKLRKRIIEAEKLYNAGTASVKDLIAPASVEVTPYQMRMDGQYIRSLFVFSYPRYLEANWLSQIINYDVSFDLSLFIYPQDSGRMMKILRRKVAQMLSTKRMKMKKGSVSDPEIDTALEDAEQLRVDLQRGTEKFFQTGLYVTLYAETEEKLNSAVKQIQTVLGGQLVMTRTSDFRVERGFESTLPQCTDMVGVLTNMNTGPLSTCFPFVSSSLTSNQGILYGLNRHNNSLIIFDRFELENANQVVFAKSGAGKSYAVKLDILRSMLLGSEVIVLDPENEYEALCTEVGGSYINVSLNSRQRINPFDLPPPLKDADTQSGDLLRENVVNLTGLMHLMLGQLTPLEEGIMDKAILMAYAQKGITPYVADTSEMEMPTMSDLQVVLQQMEGGNHLALRLERYTSGTFAGLFDQQTNVDLDNHMVVFSIRDLEDSLRPMAMYILLNFIWAKVRSSLRRRVLVVDEAWNIVQHEQSARFLHNLSKRARKYYLGITTITQDVEDFLQSRWGKPIITNSSIQLLLRQSPTALDYLQKVFHLTEGEKYLLLNSGVGQGLFFAGNQHVAIQVIASPSEDKIITTKPQDVVQQRNDEQL